SVNIRVRWRQRKMESRRSERAPRAAPRRPAPRQTTVSRQRSARASSASA
ncbi:unnamed protein product, partial [Arctia plantaginis]